MSLPKRQTSLLCITLVATGIFAWQLIELFTHDIAAAPPKPAITEAAIAPVAAPSFNPAPPLPHEEDRDFQVLLRRYELAKLQHRLADEELAIAKAQQSIHELTQNTNDTVTSHPTQPWQLKYLGCHQQLWSATVAHGEQLINITAGMKLNDHLYVTRIDAQGVWLRSPQHSYQLSFSGLTRLTPLTHPTPTVTHAENVTLSPSPTAAQQDTVTENSGPKPTLTAIQQSAPIAKPANIPPASFDETVLLAMPNHSFTLKLATDADKQTLLHLIHKHKINSRSFIYSHPCDKQRCYSLVYGDFLTLPAAQAAQAALPSRLRELNPEITSLRSIQKSLQQHI